jgi:hypothetical protein
MTFIAQSDIAIGSSAIAAKLGVLLAIGVAGFALIGSTTPAAAFKRSGQGGTSQTAWIAKPVVRDHRKAQPMVRDHRGVAAVRDHRGSLNGGKNRRIPCLGNLC